MTLRAAFISSFFFFFVLCLFGRIVRSPIGSNRWNDKKTLNKKFGGEPVRFCCCCLPDWWMRGGRASRYREKNRMYFHCPNDDLSHSTRPPPPLIWFVVSLSTLSISKTVPGCLFSFDSIAWALTLLSKMINAARNVHEEMEGKNKKKYRTRGSDRQRLLPPVVARYFFFSKAKRSERNLVVNQTTRGVFSALCKCTATGGQGKKKARERERGERERRKRDKKRNR